MAAVTAPQGRRLDHLSPAETIAGKMTDRESGEKEPVVSRETARRVLQIEAQALQKLNRSHKCQQLRGYLN